MLAKRSLTLIIGLVLTIVYSAYSLSIYVYDLSDIHDHAKVVRTKRLLASVATARLYAKTDMQSLRGYLDASRTNNIVDFYRVEKAGKPVMQDGEANAIEVMYRASSEPDHFLELGKLSYVNVQYGDVFMQMGVYTSKNAFIRQYLYDNKFKLLHDVILVIGLIGLVVAFFLRDFTRLIRKFQRNELVSLDEAGIHSKEGAMLAKTFHSYQKSTLAERENVQLLRKQLLPALRSELDSGRVAPYDFDCTMVRTDINSFSTIFNTDSRSAFMTVIDEFFQECTKIISKYDGLVSEFVGDEIIYYFKDDNHDNSAAMAISAVRDINELAAELDQFTREEFGFAFTVKSSLSKGTLRYGKLINRMGIAGTPYIQTVRILDLIEERETNTVYYDLEVRNSIMHLCQSRYIEEVELKGFSEPVKLFAYESHICFDDLLRTLSPANLVMLQYFRGNGHVKASLQLVRDKLVPEDAQFLLFLVNVLRQFHYVDCDEQIHEMYLAILDRLLVQKQRFTSVNARKLVSAVVNLASTFITPEYFDEAIHRSLQRFMQYDDDRVVANVVEIYTNLAPRMQLRGVRELRNHQSSRIRANAVLKLGLEDLNSDVLRLLERDLQERNHKHVASALYVIGELASHYKANSPIFFETNETLHDLLRTACQLVQSPNFLIRHQALVALKKVDLDAFNELVEKMYSTTISLSLRDAIREVFFPEADALDKSA